VETAAQQIVQEVKVEEEARRGEDVVCRKDGLVEADIEIALNRKILIHITLLKYRIYSILHQRDQTGI
jgi:hypothetical protein